MRLIRTLTWIVITAILVSFMAMNWHKADVNIWPTTDGYLHLQWPVGVIAVAFFLLGLLPMWLLSKTGRWRMNRRISALENSVRAATAPVPPPLATTTQLDAAAQPSQPEGPQT